MLQQQDQGQLTAEAAEFIEIIINEARSMQVLIDDLLGYSRVDSDARPMELVDCGQVFKETIQLFDATIQERDAEITHGPLPKLNAYRTQMGQLFQNLLGNAIKYCHRRPKVHVTASRLDG